MNHETRKSPASLLVAIAGWLLVSLIAGCSSLGSLPEYARSAAEPVSQSLIFVIHGDGRYSFVDDDGVTRLADRVTVDAARSVAESNPDAEVLIFHEEPRRRSFLFFSRPDGKFYYYRNGREEYSDTYRRSGKSRFEPVVRRVEHFASDAAVRMLFYYGHEIPEIARPGYDASYPLRTFGVDEFADAVARMTARTATFDLVTLATCFGGTPSTVASLAPYTKYVLASPDNLHLSYLDLAILHDLGDQLVTGADVKEFADRFARSSFDRLNDRVHTTVSLAVYDTERTQSYLGTVLPLYRGLMAEAYASNDFHHVDCLGEPAFRSEAATEGVTLYYRAARFGRSQSASGEHSGWMCSSPAQR